MNLDQYIAEGEASFHATSPGEARITGYPSSPAYDARLITWHVLYWTGETPKAIATSRGHSYRVTMPGGDVRIVTIENYRDHRDGVRLVAANQ